MLTLKCTQKAAKEFGHNRQALPEIPAEDNQALLGDWFVNLIKFGRTKSLIFVNAATLYSFLLMGYKKKDLQKISTLFNEALRFHLLAEAIPVEDIERVLSQYDTVTFAKTDSRSVLGSMNDLAWLYEVMIMSGGGLQLCDLTEATQNINRTPQLTRDGYSIDLLKKALAVAQD